jgi:PAS fold.
MQSLIDLFGLKDLIPHGYCLSWSPVLLWLNVVSDLLMTLAFFSIPLMLVYFIRQRKDLPYARLVALFAGVIVACGTTHLLAAITVWIPLYWLDGLLKGFTAIISVATAVLMLRVIPDALSAPSAAQLQAEIQQRKAAEHALRESENKLATILDSVEAFIYIKDCNYQYQYANQSVQQVFGKALEDIIGKSDDAFLMRLPRQNCAKMIAVSLGWVSVQRPRIFISTRIVAPLPAPILPLSNRYAGRMAVFTVCAEFLPTSPSASRWKRRGKRR